MEAVGLQADLGRVVVGDQGVVRRVDDGLAQRRADACDRKDGDHRSQTGPDGEQTPGGGTDDRHAHPGPAVGVVPDEHLATEREERHGPDEAEDAAEIEIEVVADVGCEDDEGGAVELVDRVEPEQDEQRQDRPAFGHA